MKHNYNEIIFASSFMKLVIQVPLHVAKLKITMPSLICSWMAPCNANEMSCNFGIFFTCIMRYGVSHIIRLRIWSKTVTESRLWTSIESSRSITHFESAIVGPKFVDNPFPEFLFYWDQHNSFFGAVNHIRQVGCRTGNWTRTGGGHS